MPSLKFQKYEAAGNDFILIDARHDDSLLRSCALIARDLCDRHKGIGADGILVITRTINNDDDMDSAMNIINADGSIAAMCGNGIRCAARYLYEFYGFDKKAPLRIGTLGGTQIVQCIRSNTDTWQLEVEMAHVERLDRVTIVQKKQKWVGQIVNVGNPHAVFEVDSPHIALASAGEFLSNHETFPDRSNIEFIRPISDKSIELTVYERGVGPTLACGTGCTAAAVSYAFDHNQLNQNIEIHAPGGILSVTVPDDLKHVKLRGPASHVFEGKISDRFF